MKAFLLARWKAVLAALVVVFIFIEARGEGDFQIFLAASEDLFRGENIYQKLYLTWYHYYYDLVFAILLYPLTFLPLYPVKLCWLLANVYFFYRVCKIICSWIPLAALVPEKQKLILALSIFFVFSLIRDNFHLSQVTIFILYLSLEGLFLIETGRLKQGSLMLAFGITVKVLPVLFLPYLVYRRKLKAAMFILLFIFTLLILPSAFVGYEQNNYLLSERWKLIDPTNDIHVADTDERSFHSLSTLLATLLVEDAGDIHAMPVKRNIANIPLVQLHVVINVFRFLIFLLAFYFLKLNSLGKDSTGLQKLYEIGYICLVTPLLFPHQQIYAFFYVFPATFYLVYFLFQKVSENGGLKKDRGLITGLVIVYLLLNLHFILGQFNAWYDHFKTLSYGVLLLLILYALHPPEKIKPDLAGNTI